MNIILREKKRFSFVIRQQPKPYWDGLFERGSKSNLTKTGPESAVSSQRCYMSKPPKENKFGVLGGRKILKNSIPTKSLCS